VDRIKATHLLTNAAAFTKAVVNYRNGSAQELVLLQFSRLQHQLQVGRVHIGIG
jgi:hypothetical protein